MAVLTQRVVVGDLVVPHREAGGQLDVPFGAELGAVQAVVSLVFAVAGAVFQGDAHGGDLGEVKAVCIADQGIQRDAHQRPGVGQEEVGFLHIAEGAGGAEDGVLLRVLHLDVQVAAAVVLGGVVEFQFQEGVFLAACCRLAQVDGATWRAEGQPGARVSVSRVGRRVGLPACGLGDVQVACAVFLGLDFGGAIGGRGGQFEGPAGGVGGGVEVEALGLDIAGGVFHVQRDARGGHGLQFDLEAAEVFHRVGKEGIDVGGIHLLGHPQGVLLGEVEGEFEVGGVETALHIKHCEGVGGGGVLVVEVEGAVVVLPFRIGLLCIVVYPIYVFISFPGLRSEIDGAAHGVMDAAHIQHQLPVNEDPAVVVPLEFEGHVLHFFIFPGGRHVDLAALGHGKGQVKALAEHVVEPFFAYRTLFCIAFTRCGFTEWHIGGNDYRLLLTAMVQIKRTRLIHVIGPVRVLFEGAAFRAAVVFPVPVLVLSEGKADVAVDAAQRDVQGVVAPQEGLAEIGGRVAVLGQGVVGQDCIHQIAAGTVISPPHVGVVRVVVQPAVHFVQGVELSEAVRQVVIPGPVT